MDINKIFQETFLNEVQERNKKQSLSSRDQRDVAEAKLQKLIPIKEFLDLFVDAQVYVRHKDFYSPYKKEPLDEPVLFSYYTGTSSHKYSPGISIFIEHPEIEIAIPNKREEGIVVIYPTSRTPDDFLISQHFENFDNAVKALGKFISRCTIKIERPQGIIASNTSNNSNNFFSSIPTNPKEKKSHIEKNIESLFSDEDKNK